jgi:signal transduction histidine kinase
MLTQVEYANEKVRKTENVKRQFLCNMSHELRTPMNIIIGFAELLSETTLEGEQNEYLRQIKTSSLNLLGIINDIIDFSNIEAERIEITNSEFNLGELAREAVAKNLELCKPKNLNLILKFDPRIDFGVISDPERLRQILLNLINNAVKFTHKGEIQVCVSLESLAPEPGRALVKFEIIDEGIGIDEDKQSDLFSPFVQADASLTRRYGGAGLGLSISNHLVRLLGSNKIFCESKPGKGSNFYFVIDFLKGKAL